MVDALDERDDEDEIRVLLQLLSSPSSIAKNSIGMFLISRTESPVWPIRIRRDTTRDSVATYEARYSRFST